MFGWCRSKETGKGLFPRSIVAGAPYQFSDFCVGCLLAAATICFFADSDDDGDTAAAVILAFVCLVSVIELLFGLPVFVWLFNFFVNRGWICQ
jgi:hypothetical protein